MLISAEVGVLLREKAFIRGFCWKLFESQALGRIQAGQNPREEAEEILEREDYYAQSLEGEVGFTRVKAILRAPVTSVGMGLAKAKD